MNTRSEAQTGGNERTGSIAIVGMALTVPGADSPARFWENLRDGVESIRRLDEAALLEAGESPELLRHPDYVPAAATLDSYADFDAELFGFSPKEAAILDPQHRKFFEVAWEALENAGHPPGSFDGDIGVYGGCGMGSYFYFNLCSNPDLVDDVGLFLLRHTGNDKDFLSTRVSYLFDLQGPSVNVQTACSTSLVAVHEACRSLREGECDMALAGGVTIELPQGRGYVFKENEILSPDGHCHAFDHRAKGTVFGSGAGVVALRRLEDALADGDHIHAVIRGSAINNDGADKASYLAPSVDGQSAAVRAALEDAGVSAGTIGYVECHGTGTYLGDPIEIAALTDAFRDTTQEVGFCGVGSVKTNIGHLDTAAGVVSLIKAALAIEHAQLPPSLGYEAPNPTIDFETSPFRVNHALTDWAPESGPRRASVNSLGVGGTNAHVVLEEAPKRAASEESEWPFQLLTLSAQSGRALDANTERLIACLEANPDVPLADIAYTLHEGRTGLAKRRVVVAEDHADAIAQLREASPRRVHDHEDLGPGVDVAFLFPGGGAQYPNMARDLYETEPVFADWMDRGLDHLESRIGRDPRADLLPEPEDEEAAAERLKQPSVQLPLIMIVEFALAQLWLSWGVRPTVLAGHSMGENTAAALAGVMSFEDCIDLVLLRGRLFDTVPAGGMLSVPLPVEQLRPYLGDDLDIAAVNAPALCAVSGPNDALAALAERLAADDVECQRIAIDIAAHSRMLDPILAEFRAFLQSLDLKRPTMPFTSNRTGALITDAEATDPEYWVQQLRRTVMFGDCVATLAAREDRVFLEVGPGKALSTLARMQPGVKPAQVLSSLRHPDDPIADDAHFLTVVGQLWACGFEADWDQIWGEAKRNRVQLPTYAFQRARYFIEPGKAREAGKAPALMRNDDMAEWGFAPVWQKAYAQAGRLAAQGWLLFVDESGLGQDVAKRLRDAGQQVTTVTPGDSFARLAADAYTLPTEQGAAPFEALVQALSADDRLPDRIAHFWLVTQGESFRPGSSFAYRNTEHGFYALTHLAQALAAEGALEGVHVSVFSNGAAQVSDEPLPYPEKALVAGPVGVVPKEIPGTTWAWADIDLPVEAPHGWFRHAAPEVPDALLEMVLEDLAAPPRSGRIAYRDGTRFEQVFLPLPLPEPQDSFRKGGTYLITGGLGGIGVALARDLQTRLEANVILTGRSELPDRARWAQVLHQSGPQARISRAITALQALEALPGSVTYAAGDIGDTARLATIRDEALARFGRIDGVIHAAGTIDDGSFLEKGAEGIEAVFYPKVTGARALEEVFPDGSIGQLVLFASSSTATNPAGQLDYVAANAFLNAYAAGRKGGATRVTAVNWGVWADTGMAAEAKAERLGDGAGAPQALALLLFDTTRFDAEGRRVLSGTHRAGAAWVFDEHKTRAGESLLPGTGYLELAAEAMLANRIAPPFEIRDLVFLNAMGMPHGGSVELLGFLSNTAEGFRFEVRTARQQDGRAGSVLHAEADILPVAAPDRKVDLAAIRARCPETGPLTAPQEVNLSFGPRWKVLRETRRGAGEGIAELALPEACRDDLHAGIQLHPALLDQATGWAIDLAEGYDQSQLWVPLSYRSVRVFSPLPEEIVSHMRLASETDGLAEFDITLCARDGTVLVEIEGFAMKRLDQSAAFGAASSAGFEPDDSADAPLSPAETRLHHNISQGIRASEGAEALRRALASGASTPYVSSLDLAGLIDQSRAPEPGAEKQKQTFAKPQTDTEFAAPQTPVEKTLAAVWEDLLGVAPIGRDDDFFDLGGHSLLAVRLFAAIKRAFAVQFPISVLFDAPTIARIAELVEAEAGPVQAGDGASDAAPVVAEKPRHLVQLHEGDGAGHKPFFLVAGMFGNVLNLRHLAMLIGKDRPVYGLQARGLLDDEAPHETVGEAAADYLAEVRRVQPEGPYLLGGFSGGGITAYEMAQQLRAAGEAVSALVLLDTPLPVRPSLTRRDKALIKLAELREKGPGYLGEWAKTRVAWELHKRGIGAGDTPDTEGSFHDTKIEQAFLRSVARYDLQPWDGPLTLFRPPLDKTWPVSDGNYVSRAREYVFHDNQWTPFAPHVEVIEVPGDHDSMVLVPNVSVLAKRLKAVIDTSDRDGAARPEFHYMEHEAAE